MMKSLYRRDIVFTSFSYSNSSLFWIAYDICAPIRISRLVYCNHVIKIGIVANAPYTMLVRLRNAIR